MPLAEVQEGSPTVILHLKLRAGCSMLILPLQRESEETRELRFRSMSILNWHLIMHAVCLLWGNTARRSNVRISRMTLEDYRNLMRLKCYIVTEAASSFTARFTSKAG